MKITEVSSVVDRRITPVLVIAVVAALSMSCVKRVSLQDTVVRLAAENLNSLEVTYYRSGFGPAEVPYESSIECVFATEYDLKAIAERRGVIHLDFRLFACGSPSESDKILSGPLFNATVPDSVQQPETSSKRIRHYYKVYLPVEFSAAVTQQAAIYVEPRVEEKLANVRREGLCLKVAGYSMGGRLLHRGVRSQLIRVPVELVEDQLKVVTETAGRPGADP